MKKVAKSNKEPKVEHRSNVAQQEKKKVSVQKRKGSEIDEIFAAKKRKKLEMEKKAEAEAEAEAKAAAAKVRPLDKNKGKSLKSRSFGHSSVAVSSSGPRKKTADGLAVFSEEELGIGKPDAGGTALCPFDCDCCF